MTKLVWLQERLKKVGYITGLEAMNHGNYYRLSDGILKLRQRGWQIATEKIHTGVSQYARYWLVGEMLQYYMNTREKELREVKGVMYVVDIDYGGKK